MLVKILNVYRKKINEVIRHTHFEGGNFVGKNVSLKNCQVGYGTYFAEGTRIGSAKIGRYTCIGPNVITALGKHPTHKFVSMYPAFFSKQPVCGFSYTDKQKFDELKFASEGYCVSIGNDVWIGAGAIIFDGVSIGDGSVIAAGAVVTRDVSPFTIAGGIPAHEIGKRFAEIDRNFLIKLKWWNQEEEWIKRNAQYFDDIETLKNNILDGVVIDDEDK